ncbi:SMI1/KNR4 family protein [Undibacterium sp. TC4M20W]|uniref:SMI1/KNR4 family protein n=1 Tax=Undibacterium sp. TC4M20W TaxID=3413052 RepID=UPI003BEFDF4B
MFSYLKWLDGSGLVLDETDIVGVAKEEILEIEREFNVPLPGAYKDFLQQCGRKAGLFARDINMFYPDILGIRECYEGVKEEYGIPFEVPKDAFIFYAYQGGFFHYFICDGNEDPEIYSVNDGQIDAHFVIGSFSTFIKEAILSYQKAFYDSPSLDWIN